MEARLRYWLAGLECGALDTDEVTAELDALIVEQGEAVSPAAAELAWRAVRGKNALIGALRNALREMRLEPDAPVSREARERLRRVIGRKWTDGVWDMETAIGRLYRLACGCHPRDSAEFVRPAMALSDGYDLALEGYGDMDQVVDLFLKLIHEEDA